MTEHFSATILIVDDVASNLDLLVDILTPHYEVMAATDGPSALQIAKQEQPDLILLDIMMPGMNGYQVCQRLKANDKTHHIPVVFVTALLAPEDEARGFAVGGVDYITKPVTPPTVLARVKTHLHLASQQQMCELTVARQINEIRQNYKDSIYMLGQAGHYNDDDIGMHIWRMASYSKALACAIGWPVKKQNLILLAASMHDTGKIGIPDYILKKKGQLTIEERDILRRHTIIGNKILSVSSTPLFKMAAEIALNHHEEWGGEGYPNGLSGEEIPESARIVAVADVFDSLTMKRPYRRPWPVKRASEYIKNSRDRFEPRLVEAFIEIEDQLLKDMKRWNIREKNKTL